MPWKFKQGNSVKVITEKTCGICGERLITDRVIKCSFKKFRSGNTTFKDELKTRCPSDLDDSLVNAI